ncbi:MAG TPA: 3D domain-containing protein [Pseudobacteroides sp.]|nr:3D domain-containing protein [Pseudobacteroides sp.]
MNNNFSITGNSNNINLSTAKSTTYLSRYISDDKISTLSCPDILEDILRSAEEEISHTTGIKGLKKHIDSIFKVAPYLKKINYKKIIQEKIDRISDFSQKIYREDIDPTVLLPFIKKYKFIAPVPAFIILGTIAAFNLAPEKETIPVNSALECKSVSYNSTNEIAPISEEKKATLDSQILSNYNLYSYFDIYSTNNTKNKVIDKTALNSIQSASASSKNTKAVSTVTNKNAVSKTAGKSILSRSSDQRENMDDIIRNSKKSLKMVATAYDLSVKSCGKSPSHPAYGITKTGTRATIGRTIAVDPKIIPLNSKVYIEFPDAYKNLNGVYIAEDTGSKIKGNKIDVFFGEDAPGDLTVNNLARKFGIQPVTVYILGD